MTIRVHPVHGEDGFREAALVRATAFGHRFEDEKLEKVILPALAHVNVFGAFEDGRMVGVAVDQPLELTVPGGRFVKTGGLTWVGVLPTHRRRGVLTALMEHHQMGLRELGMPLSILLRPRRQSTAGSATEPRPRRSARRRSTTGTAPSPSPSPTTGG